MQQLLKAYTRQPPRHRRTARDEAVSKNAYLVQRAVRKVSDRVPSTVDRASLFSAGMLGLLTAIDKFDAGKGISFEAYASIRIRGAILDELRGLDHLTRVQRKQAKTVQSSRDEMAKRRGTPADDLEVAREVGLSVEEVQQSRVRGAPPETVDPNTLDIFGASGLWEQQHSALDRLERNEQIRILSKKIAQLPERSRLVLGLCYEAELTLQEIGEILGVTQSRVSQIIKETKAILRKQMKLACT